MLAVNTFNMHIPAIIRDGFCSNFVAVSFCFPLINPSLACCSCLLHFLSKWLSNQSLRLLRLLRSTILWHLYVFLRSVVLVGPARFYLLRMWSRWVFCILLTCALDEFSALCGLVTSLRFLRSVPSGHCAFSTFRGPLVLLSFVFLNSAVLLSLHAVFRGWRPPTILMDTSHYCLTLSVLSVCTHGILQHSPQFVSRYSFSLLYSSRPCGPESWI